MDRTVKLVGTNSNEIFVLRYPTTLLNFCEFDFTYFAKHSIDLCNEMLKTGKEEHDRVSDLRRDIQSAHCFIEHNIRGVYEKIVLDCWIDYVCRRDNIGTSVLWNRFIRCKTDFEKTVFSRLCDFRYNRASNEWVNLVRVQDYARSKIDFIFVDGMRAADEAVARRNYFDLTFSVTARELGCRIEDLGVVKTFSVGRVPTAPFMFPTISKDIVRNVLSDFDYNEDYSNVGDYGAISDKLAMDAFSRMKAGLPQDLANYGVVRGKMDSYVDKIYMPCSLKAAVDLEVDAMIEHGEWLGKCRRCGRYFLRSEEHPELYCSRIVPNGKTCLEIWQEEHPRPAMNEALEKKSRLVTDKMYSRVGKDMNVKEYEYWHTYMEAMKQKVGSGEILPDEFESFLEYSLDVDITRSTPIVEVPKREEAEPFRRERVVKPFVPERIDRSELAQPAPPDPDDERALKEGFFTSPSKQRKKNEKPQISHIIRNGESLGSENYSKNPDPAGFQPFGSRESTPEPEQRTAAARPAQREQRSPHEDLNRLEERLDREKQLKRERAEEIARRRDLDEQEAARKNAVHKLDAQPFDGARLTPPVTEPPTEPDEEPPFPIYDEVPEDMKPSPKPRRSGNKPPEIPQPKPKVIRKNAAAISAYGKAAGAPVVTAAQADIVLPREEPSFTGQVFGGERLDEPPAEKDPFADIGSIFDVLEQSEEDGSRRAPRNAPHGEPPAPRRVTRETAPAGIWTEERGLFDGEPEPSELDMLKSKKHGKSNKTRRLYDVIMREPDSNPNIGKKK